MSIPSSQKQTGGNGATRLRRLMAPAVIAMAALTLAGCKHSQLKTGSIPTDGYRAKHPIVISEAPEHMDIPVGRGATRLSRTMRGSVAAFASDARSKGNGRIDILVPAGSANENAAMHMADQLTRLLVRRGLSRRHIVRRSYRVSDPKAVAPVRMSYLRIKASVRECGMWRDSMTRTAQNRHYSEFGCATQSNLARMVANPADLLYPRGQDPSDPMRRSEAIDKYRKGEPAATKYSDEEGAKISDAAGGK